jgi:hypothetical protein
MNVSKLKSSITSLLGNKQAVMSQLMGFIDFDNPDDVVYVSLVRGNGFGVCERELNFEDVPILEIRQGNVGCRVKSSPLAYDAAETEMVELRKYINDELCAVIARRLNLA